MAPPHLKLYLRCRREVVHEDSREQAEGYMATALGSRSSDWNHYSLNFLQASTILSNSSLRYKLQRCPKGAIPVSTSNTWALIIAAVDAAEPIVLRVLWAGAVP